MYNIWLLVAGGCCGGNLATVELFNTSTNQWLTASPLPTPSHYLTSAIVQDDCCIVTNSKQVFCVCLPNIVSQTVDQSTTSKSPTPLWSRLPDTLPWYSAAIAFRGSLLTVGGYDNRTSYTDIRLYQPESGKWTKVGDIPAARNHGSSVVLPSGDLLVTGGQDSSLKLTSQVDVASVLKLCLIPKTHVAGLGMRFVSVLFCLHSDHL